MEISLRAQSMPESPIRKLAKYADAAKLAGTHRSTRYPDAAASTRGGEEFPSGYSVLFAVAGSEIAQNQDG